MTTPEEFTANRKDALVQGLLRDTLPKRTNARLDSILKSLDWKGIGTYHEDKCTNWASKQQLQILTKALYILRERLQEEGIEEGLNEVDNLYHKFAHASGWKPKKEPRPTITLISPGSRLNILRGED